MRNVSVTVLCLAASFMMAPSAGNGLQAATTPTPRKLAATRAKIAPVIDGKLDDACWKEAALAADFSVFSNPQIPHKEKTIGRVCYDDDYLYIALECTVKEMDKFKKRNAEAAGKFDYAKGGVIEVFLDTHHNRKTFDQYLLHSNGSSQITLSKDDLFKILNEDYLKSKAVMTDTGFTIESAFPLAMLHLRSDTPKIWGFNLNRAHDLYDEHYNTDDFFSSWNSTQGKGFPSPECFGELVINDDLSRFFWKVEFAREPQPGDSKVQLKITNETGRDFEGKLAFSITRPKGKKFRAEKPVSFKAGMEKIIGFDHFLSAADLEAKFELTLTDSAGKVCYLGGTQKEDLTPGDSWAAPTPTEEQKKAGLIAFHRPYCQPVLHRAVPKAREIVSELSLTACRGEFEPITLELYPLRNIKTLKASVSNLTGPDGTIIPSSAFDVRYVMAQSDWKNPRSFEAKEHLLRKLESLALVQGRTQRLWLTVKVGDKANAGEYRGTVSLNSDGTASEIPLVVRVLPFELSPPDKMGYFMYYPGVTFKPTSNEDYFKKTVKDMRDHGMTTFTIYNWVQVEGGPNGKSHIDVDGRVADNLGVTYARMMDILQKEGLGKDVPFFDVFSMHYKPDLIVQLDKICRERNWPEVLFYICDEIDYPERITQARKILTDIKKLAPDIKTTTALGPKGAAALGQMYDVWIGCSTPEMIQKCLSLGKSPWTYSCRADFEVCPAFERSFFGRYAWKRGLKGVGLWSYAENKTFFDRFGRQYDYGEMASFTPEWKQNFGHVYFEKDQIIPTVTWEAVREGIDDYRYLLTLKKTAEAARADKDPAKRFAGETGLKLLKEITDRINPEFNTWDLKYGRNWQLFGDMDKDRAQIIEAILKLQENQERGL